jgi:hypothetical protein
MQFKLTRESFRHTGDATKTAPFFLLTEQDVFAALPDLSALEDTPNTQKSKINPMDDPSWGLF